MISTSTKPLNAFSIQAEVETNAVVVPFLTSNALGKKHVDANQTILKS